MDTFNNYDGIRPYYDNEVNKVINSLLEEVEFMVFLRYLFPNENKKKLIDKLSKIDNVYEFQLYFAQPAIHVILNRSVDSFTNSGINSIEKDNCYLYISNHRDIALDPSLFNLILHENNFPTCQVAIGSNLLVSPLVTNMLKLNRSFIVHRNVSARQLYLYSKQLSFYIYELITQRKSSAWIAQREGRSKDGNDITQHGLIKMLVMNKEEIFYKIIFKLNIVPVSVSYEYEPCDLSKAEETYCFNNDIPYYKTPEQDLNNLLSGMKNYKGRVHISFCKKINEIFDFSRDFTESETDFITLICEAIDKEIHTQYKLWPTNYIAYDIVNGSENYKDNYSEEQKVLFVNHIDEMIEKTRYDKNGVKDILLKIYSNPVQNKMKYQH